MLIHNLVITGSVSLNGTDVTGITGSNDVSSSFSALSGSFVAVSSSFVAVSSSYSSASGSLSSRVTTIESKYATTGSNIFTQNQTICGNLTTTGTITAQTINVQQVTSSIVYSSGSNIFGCSLANTQQLTGSVTITGSLVVTTTAPELTVGNTGVTLGNVVTDIHNVTGSLRITGSGNHWFQTGCVGIGTTNPTQRLHICGTGGSFTFSVDQANSAIIRGNAASIFDINNEGGGCIRLYGTEVHVRTTSVDPAVVVSNAGRVGIGTTTPGGVLEVSCANSGNTQMLLVRNFATSATGNFTGCYTAEVRATSNGNVRHAMLINNAENDSTRRVLDIISNAGTIASFVSNGNVGIGTCTPQRLLEIRQGGTSTTPPSLFFGGITQALVGGEVQIAFSSNISPTLGTPTATELARAGIGFQYVSAAQPSEFSIGIQCVNTCGSSVKFWNVCERMRITCTGNVGIGTNPNVKFQVNDGTNINLGIKVGQTNTSAVMLNAFNDGAIANIPLEFRASSYSFILGNVGIGTTSPGNIVHALYCSGGTVNYYDGARYMVQQGCNLANNFAGISFLGSGGSDAAAIWTQISSHTVSATTGNLIFGTTNSGGASVERMRITSTGAVQISAPTSGQALTATGRSNAWTAEIVGSSTTGQSYGLRVRAGTNASDVAVLVTSSANTPDLFSIRGDGYIITGLAANSPYNNTTAAAANMHVADNGSLARSTSSLKYKTDVFNYCKGLSEVMQLRPVSYKGKTDGDKVFAGLIAEEVHELGLSEFVNYENDGTPDALAYQNMVALLTKAIQELKAENDIFKTCLGII
jgi:hypothetical protein